MNLVPLHIDKDTGKIVARGRTVSVGGVSSGFYFEQVIPTQTWEISHNVGNDKLLCQIFTMTGEQLFSDSLTIIDINTVQVNFSTPQAGKAHIIFFNV